MDITLKRIGDKASNLRTAWKKARQFCNQSGLGVRAEDNQASFNALLESKCPLFWRLDEMWGSRPNTTLVLILDSTQAEIETPDIETQELEVPDIDLEIPQVQKSKGRS